MDIDIYFCLVLSRQCGRKNTTQMDAKLGITVLANDLDKALRLKYYHCGSGGKGLDFNF